MDCVWFGHLGDATSMTMIIPPSGVFAPPVADAPPTFPGRIFPSGINPPLLQFSPGASPASPESIMQPPAGHDAVKDTLIAFCAATAQINWETANSGWTPFNISPGTGTFEAFWRKADGTAADAFVSPENTASINTVLTASLSNDFEGQNNPLLQNGFGGLRLSQVGSDWTVFGTNPAPFSSPSYTLILATRFGGNVNGVAPSIDHSNAIAAGFSPISSTEGTVFQGGFTSVQNQYVLTAMYGRYEADSSLPVPGFDIGHAPDISLTEVTIPIRLRY